MRTYFAMQSKIIRSGGWLTVLYWARSRIRENPVPVKIFTARSGEKYARVVAEITTEGECLVKSGRSLPVKAVLNGKG